MTAPLRYHGRAIPRAFSVNVGPLVAALVVALVLAFALEVALLLPYLNR